METKPDDSTSPWQAWIGRSERLQTRADGLAVALLEESLDRPPLADDAPVPPLRHWLFSPPRVPTAALDPDGHPPRGALVPPWPLPRRMWAGSSVRWLAKIPADSPLERRTTVESVTTKSGRSGMLGFVTLRHEWFAGPVMSIDETQTLVYREAPPAAAGATSAGSGSASQAQARTASSAAPGAAPGIDAAGHPLQRLAGGGWERLLVPTTMLLFRYSALTFNTHRIHYDRDYATGSEGYPGLVVHGPLMATLMLDAFRDANPDATITRFTFRAMLPAFDGQPLWFGGEPAGHGTEGSRIARLWVRGADGAVHVQGDVDYD